MNHRKDNNERRSFRRLRAKEGAFAVLRPQCTKLGQIVDISEGGLAFHYVFTGNQKNGEHEVDIFLAGNGFYLEKIPVKTVCDFKITKKIPTSSVPLRRCSLEFNGLEKSKASKIEYFLSNHTLSQ